jgi:hypothetical protein
MRRPDVVRSATVALFVAAAAAAAEPTPAFTNRLARESSPYLLQHAHNPVDWFPWGPEAFAKAKKENKPIFLSVGYSSCHWCHVMERESFENADVAKLLNDSFVSIKVDREERPDVDQIYMTALQLQGNGGGWPMSMFLTPDGKPMFGGTYWPREDRAVQGQQVRGFKSVIQYVAELYRDRRPAVVAQADRIAARVAAVLAQDQKPAPMPARAAVAAAVTGLRAEFDPKYGGFSNPTVEFRGPKFPMPANLDFLLTQVSNAADAEGMIRLTLEQMANGGVYDQLGGGFHRYSTERTWTVPHFEKMLYDNAQLVEVYSRAFRRRADPLYRRVVEETLEFVRRELTAPEGGFYSALDADSAGEEGQYYVWTAPAIDAALPEPGEAAVFKAVFGADGLANFEGGRYVLTRRRPLAEVAGEQKLSEEQVAERLRETRRKALEARSKRPRPALDSKVLTGWNGQMIAAYAAAGQAFHEPHYLEVAVKAADFLLREMRTADGRLFRTYAGSPPKGRLDAYLDDYAYLVHGLLNLNDATGDKHWLDEAKALTERMITGFSDERGGFFFTSSDHEKLFARFKDATDGAQPSGNSVAARDLLRLFEKTGDARYRGLAEKTLQAFAPALNERPETLPAMVLALDLLLVPSTGDNQPTTAAQGGGAKRSDSVVKVVAKADKPGADGKQVVTVTMKVESGWHIYANPVGNENQESSATTLTVEGAGKPRNVRVDYPPGKLVKDPLVGNYSIYEGEVTIKATVQRASGDKGPLDVKVKFQSCSDKTCLLPATVRLSVP